MKRLLDLILGLPLIWKGVGLGVLALGLWWGKTWYDNRQRNIGAEKERFRILDVLKIESEEQWAERLKRLEEREAGLGDREAEIAQDRTELDAEAQRIAADRQRLSVEIRRSADEFERRLRDAFTASVDVADRDLVGELHRLLAVHRQRDAARDRGAPPAEPGAAGTPD